MKLLDIYKKSDMFRSAKGGEVSAQTASLFVSGVLLKEIFMPSLSFCYLEEYTFEQIWYMLCLHHDKNVENPRVWEKVCAKGAVWNVWERFCSGFAPLFCYGEGIRYNNGICVRESLLTESEVRDFFCYRNTCYTGGGADHGIVGGLRLFENLICRHLKSGEELDRRVLNHYSYVSNVMTVHNLFERRKPGDEIAVEEDPLLFLLVLSEWMEPLQYARAGIAGEKVLQAAEIKLSKSGIVLHMDPLVFDVNIMEKGIENLKKKIAICCETERDASDFCISM